MKTIKNILFLLLLSISMISCEKYTDINPKGKNLLSTVDELDYLLNINLGSSNAFYMQNLYGLTNDMYPTTVSSILAGPKNLNYAILTYDESINRAELQKVDIVYEQLYSLINTRLNVLLETIDKASGDANKAKRLKAEALVLRGFLHYLVVNIYAKAYNPATAASDGGIPYMEKINLESAAEKSSVAVVYQKILADLKTAEDLDALYDVPQVTTRASKVLLHTVKAQVLISMRDYEGALASANQALQYNNALEDHRPFIATKTAVRDNRTATDNILFAAHKLNNPTFNVASVEILNGYFDAGYIMKDYTSNYAYTIGGVNYSVQLGTQYAFAGALMFYNNSYQHNASGMTVSDLYFIKAESLIRLGRIGEGVAVLNSVKEKRYHPNNYSPISGSVSEDVVIAALKKLSRLEFLYTWKNFVNIKRWNTEEKYKETITRTMNGKTYTLSPGSALWVFPFPQSATAYNPNLSQNY